MLKDCIKKRNIWFSGILKLVNSKKCSIKSEHLVWKQKVVVRIMALLLTGCTSHNLNLILFIYELGIEILGLSNGEFFFLCMYENQMNNLCECILYNKKYYGSVSCFFYCLILVLVLMVIVDIMAHRKSDRWRFKPKLLLYLL